MALDVKAIRNRLQLYLSPEVAAHAGLTLPQLQAFVSGEFAPTLGGGGVTPTDEQLLALARRIGCCNE